MRASLLVVALLAPGCLGTSEESSVGELEHRAPVLLNEYAELWGKSFESNWSGHGPVKRVRFQPCTIELELHDGRQIGGTYVAWGYTGSYFEGIIEVTPSTPRDDGKATDLWLFAWSRNHRDLNNPYIHELQLMNVDAHGEFGEVSTTWIAGEVPMQGDQFACLQDLATRRPGLAVAPDGRTVVRPTGRAVANAALTGTYRFGDDEVARLGPCNMTVETHYSFPAGDWRIEQGNFMAHGDDVGIIDWDVSDVTDARSARESSRGEQGPTDPLWGRLYGYRREADGSLTILDATVRPRGSVTTWQRNGDWTGPADTWCLQ